MTKQPLTFGSLFAGIGGLDLGFERAGMVCNWQVEIDDYANKILRKHWPDVRRWRDVRTFPPRPLADWHVDVICGGFPCQDISYAGCGAGLDGKRSGLFFDAVRVVRQLRPRIVVLENVAALLVRGLDRVLGELAALGYDAQWHCIPAAAVGAPHIRDRVFLLGYASGSRQPRIDGRKPTQKLTNRCEDVADPASDGIGTQRNKHANEPRQQPPFRHDAIGCGLAERIRKPTHSEWWATEPDVGGNSDGFPGFLDRHTGRGLSYEESQRAVEGMRNMWDCHVSQAVHRSLRGLDRIQAAAVLFAFMCEYAKGGRIPWQLVAGTEALSEELQYLRGKEFARSASQGQKPEQQHAKEHPDIVRDMPREIASWDTFEYGIERVAKIAPMRVDRLRGLGNAVVPQVAEFIGRQIVEATE